MFQLISYIMMNCYYLLLYITNTNAFPRPLSLKEEKEYFLKMKKGDNNARNVLIERNLRLVAHIIKKYYSNTKDQDDLFSIGSVGLIKAINTFNPDKGARFATYGSRCIENEILMYFRNIKKQNSEIHLNDSIDNDKDGNNLALMDVLCCDDNIDEIVDLKIKTQKLYHFIDTALTKREREIICLRYGLLGYPPMTQQVVAKKMGISRSYVSRIEKKALLRLEKEFISAGIHNNQD